MYDLERFSMTDMIVCGSALRRMRQGSESMEEIAQNIVQYLYRQFSGAGRPEGQLALVRLFKTHPFHDLDQHLQSYARRLTDQEPDPAMKCLTLLATAGGKPEWCSRALSQGHQAIPLASEEVVARIPMIASLIHQFGLDVSHVLASNAPIPADLIEKTFSVFHVPDALGSPAVPAQAEFVIQQGIRSCLGFGGMLLSGDLFAVIMFSRVPISSDTASMFKILAVSVKLALLGSETRVFAHPSIGAGSRR